MISDISSTILFDSIGQYINTHINTNDIYIKYNINDSYFDYLNRLIQVYQYFYNTFEHPTSLYKNQKYFKIDTNISITDISNIFKETDNSSKRHYLLDNSNNFYNNINYIIEEWEEDITNGKISSVYFNIYDWDENIYNYDTDDISKINYLRKEGVKN